MKGLSSKSTESLESWKDKAKMAESQAKHSEKLLSMNQAREAKLKGELEASQNTIQELKAWLKEREVQLKDKEKEASDLEIRLTNTVSKGMY